MGFLEDLFWLQSPARQLQSRLQRQQPPQAQIIYGPAGVGKRHFALWSAAQLLGLDWEPPADSEADALPGIPHPDFIALSPDSDSKERDEDRKDKDPDKEEEPKSRAARKSRSLKIEPMRELIARLELTSHRGGHKVAVICPAERMVPNAANCLLKTLEEPRGQTTILLVCESPARLPPTILSRCERVRLVPPDWSAGLAWLQRACPGDSGAEMALAFASRTPLGARSLLRAEFGKEAEKMSAELQMIVQREVPPGTVARRWAKLETGLCIRWLYWQLAALMREAAGIAEPGAGAARPHLNISRTRLNMQACCAYLDQLNEVNRLQDRSLNQELQWVELLTWWYGAAGFVR
jgi:DNA polymerase III subunit delta'